MRPKTQELEATFNKLAEQWVKETAFHSFGYFITNHPAYCDIVAMGEPALPFVFREMEKDGYHWHYMLHEITGFFPALAEEDIGSSKKLDDAWLKWGREQGYKW